MNVGESLVRARAQLAQVTDSSRVDAEILLAHVLRCERSMLLARGEQPVDAAAQSAFDALVARRAAGEPVAYLTGEKEFWSLSFKVTPAVLIPRPETELLVEWGLELLRPLHAPRVADLGTGSGCIAIAIGRERRDAKVFATEDSEPAIAIARENVRRLRVPNVVIEEGCWFEALQGWRFDLVVSNPPYVDAGDPHLKALAHEPLSALTPGSDGLCAIRTLVEQAPACLNAGGWLLLEHGAGQSAAVRALLAEAGFNHVQSRRDLAGIERVSAGCRA